MLRIIRGFLRRQEEIGRFRETVNIELRLTLEDYPVDFNYYEAIYNFMNDDTDAHVDRLKEEIMYHHAFVELYVHLNHQQR